VSLLAALAAGYLPLECRESGMPLSLTELVVIADDEQVQLYICSWCSFMWF
jgi:hypothetical protein